MCMYSNIKNNNNNNSKKSSNNRATTKKYHNNNNNRLHSKEYIDINILLHCCNTNN